MQTPRSISVPGGRKRNETLEALFKFTVSVREENLFDNTSRGSEHNPAMITSGEEKP